MVNNIHSLLQLRVKSFLVVVYNFETCNEFLYVNRTKLVQKSIEIVWFRRFFLNSSSRKFQTTFKLRIENKIRIELTWVVVITVAVVFSVFNWFQTINEHPNIGVNVLNASHIIGCGIVTCELTVYNKPTDLSECATEYVLCIVYASYGLLHIIIYRCVTYWYIYDMLCLSLHVVWCVVRCECVFCPLSALPPLSFTTRFSVLFRFVSFLAQCVIVYTSPFSVCIHESVHTFHVLSFRWLCRWFRKQHQNQTKPKKEETAQAAAQHTTLRK